MTDRLSREGIAYVRDWAQVRAMADRRAGKIASAQFYDDILTILVAYEAQRKCPGTVDGCTSTAVLERIKIALDRPGVSESYVDWARECREAWEAQRPRPASEKPENGARVLVKLRNYVAPMIGSYILADNAHDPCWTVNGRSFSDQDVECWLPLPPSPERDDV